MVVGILHGFWSVYEPGGGQHGGSERKQENRHRHGGTYYRFVVSFQTYGLILLFIIIADVTVWLLFEPVVRSQ